MMDAYSGGLDRVSREKFNEDQERLSIVKSSLYELKIPIEKLRLFFSIYTQIELTELFKCSTYSVKQICLEFGIEDVFPQYLHRQKTKPKEVKALYNHIKYHINKSLKEYGYIL
jgi:hypothetical protein